MALTKEWWAKHREEMAKKIKEGKAKAKENKEIKENMEVKK
jgi:hypothetical protein